MVPLPETNASRAFCRTRHLTAFGASLFVPANAVTFILPERSGVPSVVVLLTCILGLLCYGVAAAILHKLDQVCLRRAAVVPLCSPDGPFKYEIQVKTGWNLGAGTTAHVGISVFGGDTRSGHHHLDCNGAFTRNTLDIFHIATETSLGNIWKIRIWHDNKGLSPAWRLQYVLVKDLQTGSSYYFLVDEWLSVDNERTDGRVEIEVEASAEAELVRWPRPLVWELQRALAESHLWLSLWERPSRSPFTLLQRATCCALLLQLCMLANSLWYSSVAHTHLGLVSRRVSVSWETLLVGGVSCLVVYPLYLVVLALLRMSRSQCVSVEQVSPQVEQESVEIDDFLDNSLAGSSFLFLNGLPGESYSEETNVDLPTPSTKSMESWSETEEDEDCDWPELLSDTSVAGGVGLGAGLPRLKRGQGSRHLGVDMTFDPDDDCNQYFTSSDEDLIKRILAEGQLQLCDAQQLLSQPDSDLADLSSILGDKTEVILLQKMSDPLTPGGGRRNPPKTAFTSNTVVTDVCRPRRFPAWCGRATLWGSWAGLVLANGLSMWAGRGFSEGVAMMWLISCIGSFLTSCFVLEPMKVVCEAVYFAVCVRRLRPEEQDVLVDSPRVQRVVQRVPRVRPPHGFALAQAQDQARKVHLLHTMLKNFLVYMLVLLLVLLLNFSDPAEHTQTLRLHSQLKHTLHTPETVVRREDLWAWLTESLLPRLLDDSSLFQETGSVLLGSPRLRQTRDTHGSGSVWSGSVNVTTAASWTGDGRSGDVIQSLTRTLHESVTSLQHLQQRHWLDHSTREVCVEFSLYNSNTDLLTAFNFLFDFPVSDRAQSSLDLLTFRLQPITGLNLQLLLTSLFLLLLLYFCVGGVRDALREGWHYRLSPWRLLGACSLVLAACVCALQFLCLASGGRQWAQFLADRTAFTDFNSLAQLSHAHSHLSALLLFLLLLKASHHLRLLREWAVFGRALSRSLWDVLAVALVLLLLLLAFAHTAHLLFHSVLEGYGSIGSACLSLLGAGGRGLLSWRPSAMMTGPLSSASSLAFHSSFAVLRLLLLWILTSALLRNYRRARAELYRPAVDLQDYEMVELFLRRLKMWMGLSRAKEFRHKVRFEGMEPPPSRSSSTSDCKSLCLPPLDAPDAPPSPDSVDAGSEASWRPSSSSPCSLTEAPGTGLGPGGPGLGPGGLGLGGPGGGSPGGLGGPGVPVGGAMWRERAESEATLRRLLPSLDALLQQLDRVTVATEELYRIECRLERAQRKAREGGRGLGRGGGGEEREGGGGERGKSRGGAGKDKRKGEESAGQKERKGRRTQRRDERSGGMAVIQPKDSVTVRPKTTPTAPLSSAPGSVSAPSDTPASLASTPKVTSAPPPTPAPVYTPSLPPTPAPNTPVPPLSSTPAQPRDWHPPQEREALPPPSSSLFNHPAHTTTISTHKRKRKPPPLKNKVHPNPDRHVSGHPKP